MEESVILNDPIILLGLIIAFVLAVFAVVKKAGFAVNALSVLFFMASITYALLSGAGLYETGAVATLFFILNIMSLQNNGGKK